MKETKIVTFENAPVFFDTIRRDGKKLVHCHGTFDLLHSGHICHLRESKELGDVLVVTVTGEKYVNKGPGRPFVNEDVRVKSLAELSCVDYIVLVPHADAVEAIECVRPHIYCKGKEYEDVSNDVTGNIEHDVMTVRKHDGEVRYLGSNVMSSTRILNNHFEVHPAEMKRFCKGLSEKYTLSDFKEAINGFSGVRVAVIGDLIFDKYSYLKVQGLTSKNRIISGRFIEEDMQGGGALAVYRHLKEFTEEVKLVSLVGTEGWVDGALRGYIEEKDDYVVRDEDFTTIVKQRFMERGQGVGDGISKLFSVNYLDPEEAEFGAIERVEKRMREVLSECDVVLLLDFGHGLFTDSVRTLIQNEAPFLAVNCQTNSSNFGYNIIDRRYRRADCFSLDEQEILLAEGSKRIDFKRSISRLVDHFGAKYGWLTRGGISTLGVKPGHAVVECPVLEQGCIDTVGAGDAFFSVASLAAYKGYPIDLATFIGQLGGAQAVKIVGNTECIKKSTLLKSGVSLLNY